jgi:hypothetical protein
MISFLLERGADEWVRNSAGKLPVQLAESRGFLPHVLKMKEFYKTYEYLMKGRKYTIINNNPLLSGWKMIELSEDEDFKDQEEKSFKWNEDIPNYSKYDESIC